MKLNLVYGRSGTGKSKTIYEDLKSKIGTGCIYLIVPEQSNLMAEKKLFEVTQKNTLIDTEVLTLSRMASRVMDDVGGNTYTRLSKVGKSMLIYDILSKEKGNLKFLGKSDKNIDVVANMLTEFKKHNINLDELLHYDFQDEYMRLKLKDIGLIYEKYTEKLQNEFIDENDSLDILANLLDETKMFNDAIIYIDDFQGFTKQEYKIFEKLLKKAREITVSVCTDDVDGYSERETDIFYFNKMYAKQLIEIAQKCKAEINKTYLRDTHRYKSEELGFLEENLYSSTSKKYTDEVQNIQLFLSNNPYFEMEHVAKEIIKLVKSEKYRYNEIGIVTKNIDDYVENAKTVFEKYEIPLFVDYKKELNQNILIRYIVALLDVYSNNWSFDSVMNFLKVGLNNFSKGEIYELENYCRKWGIKSSKWQKEFTYEEVNDRQNRLEALRKQIVQPLTKFKLEVSENRTVAEITKKIYEFLIENGINEILDKKIKSYESLEISEEYNTSYKVLVNIFDELVLLFGDEKITFEKYKELLQVGIKNSELGKIPMSQDQVILGDTDRSRSNNIKVLFVVGMNDGVFPSNSREEGFLNDKDREVLKENGFELAKTSTDLLYEEQFNIYKTFSLPEEKLYLSYYSSDKDGKSVRPSVLIKKIKRLFVNLHEESDIIEKTYEVTTEKATFEEALNVYKSYVDGEEISKEWEEILVYFYNTRRADFETAMAGIRYTNLPEKISEKNIKKLYGSNLKTSVSQLETYRKCPFSFHLTYGLKLQERPELKLNALDTGTFMHEVVDEFFKRIDERELSIKTISDEELEEIVTAIIEELLGMSKYYTLSSNAKYRLLTRRLKKVVLKAVEYIVYSIRNSDFDVLGHEIEFNNQSDFKPIQMSLFEDNTMELKGKIDRVDVGIAGNHQYVRVIDYKSSGMKIDSKKVEAGLQIQLITYLDALTEQRKDLEPSGVLYLGMVDSIVKASKNLSEEEIEAQIRKEFKMKGYVLADITVIKMMDKKLENSGTSDIIPVTLTKAGEIKKGSGTLNKDEFKELQKQVKQTVKALGTAIMQGNIDIKPYNYKDDETGCKYCKYKAICNFNTGIRGNEYDYIT